MAARGIRATAPQAGRVARCADVSHVERSNDGAAQVPYLAKSINHERMPVLISIRQTSKPGCRDHPCRRPNALDLGAAGHCPSSVKQHADVGGFSPDYPEFALNLGEAILELEGVR